MYVEVAIVEWPLRHRILALLFVEITWMVSFLVYIYGRDERAKNGEIFQLNFNYIYKKIIKKI